MNLKERKKKIHVKRALKSFIVNKKTVKRQTGSARNFF